MIKAEEYVEYILPVPIWGITLPNTEIFNKELVDFAYWLKDNSEGKTRSNFLGWQSSDFIFEDYKEFLNPLISRIEEISKDIGDKFSERVDTQLKINAMWLNVNLPKSYNAHHIHSGSLSGAYYVKVPENSGRLILVNPAGRSDASRIRIKNYGLTPVEGACIIFPSWLEHYVEPNKSSEDRISISFNID